ncbi:hypothetical protein Y032_0706g1692 [Ancylostoma ceylanicum]|uniref:Uncharacterized protein n=1 Tax=Ancylostoma ceylanicum TaxID=53326 RepID=A0A016WG94_9BILA|nr:hypothetical protein Y032_0706g1692 [Ancylostoma ceylanicum]
MLLSPTYETKWSSVFNEEVPTAVSKEHIRVPASFPPFRRSTVFFVQLTSPSGLRTIAARGLQRSRTISSVQRSEIASHELVFRNGSQRISSY